MGRDGPLFRGRFHSRLILDERHLLATCRYIHRNPLDLPGVSSPELYRWSSHRAYLGLRRAPDFVRTDTLLDAFGGDRRAFATFVAVDDRAMTPTSVADLARVADVAELVIAELGLDARGQSAAIARAATLAWAERRGVSIALLGGAFGHATRGSSRTARSRAHSLVAAEPRLLEAVERAAALVVPLQKGSDPCCNGQSAARAAS